MGVIADLQGPKNDYQNYWKQCFKVLCTTFENSNLLCLNWYVFLWRVISPPIRQTRFFPDVSKVLHKPHLWMFFIRESKNEYAQNTNMCKLFIKNKYHMAQSGCLLISHRNIKAFKILNQYFWSFTVLTFFLNKCQLPSTSFSSVNAYMYFICELYISIKSMFIE